MSHEQLQEIKAAMQVIRDKTTVPFEHANEVLNARYTIERVIGELEQPPSNQQLIDQFEALKRDGGRAAGSSRIATHNKAIDWCIEIAKQQPDPIAELIAHLKSNKRYVENVHEGIADAERLKMAYDFVIDLIDKHSSDE